MNNLSQSQGFLPTKLSLRNLNSFNQNLASAQLNELIKKLENNEKVDLNIYKQKQQNIIVLQYQNQEDLQEIQSLIQKKQSITIIGQQQPVQLQKLPGQEQVQKIETINFKKNSLRLQSSRIDDRLVAKKKIANNLEEFKAITMKQYQNKFLQQNIDDILKELDRSSTPMKSVTPFQKPNLIQDNFFKKVLNHTFQQSTVKIDNDDSYLRAETIIE